MTAYEDLMQKNSELQLVSSIQGVLYWDTNTSLPAGGLENRSRQMQYLSQLVHKKFTSQAFGELITKAENEELDLFQRRNVQLLRRRFDLSTKIPLELVGNLSKQSNRTLEIWKVAKKRNDFKHVLPELRQLFELVTRRGNIVAKFWDLDDPQEGLIQEREPGMGLTFVNTAFRELKSFLIPFVKKYATLGEDLQLQRL